jgi:hypothetical protein
MESQIHQSAKSAARNEEMTLTDCGARRLIGICVELLDLCSNVTGQINPAIGALIATARDEVLTRVVEANSGFALSVNTPQQKGTTSRRFRIFASQPGPTIGFAEGAATC